MVIIIGIIIGLGISACFFIPALLKKQKLDKSIFDNYKKQTIEYKSTLESLQFEQNIKEKELANLQEKSQNAIRELEIITKDLDNSKNNLKSIQAQENIVRKNIKDLVDSSDSIKSSMADSIDKEADRLRLEYQNAVEAYKEEYLKNLKDLSSNFSTDIQEKTNRLEGLNQQIKEKQSIYDAILEDEKRNAQEKSKQDFYRLQISEKDLYEIQKIREVIPLLKDPEILNKVIWTAYYRKPYQDLITRLFGTDKPSGIYKITSLIDGKIYIGQSTNVPNRFSEHIKRGLGAEPATKNRLYTVMKKQNVENFTFEFIEKVPKDKLDEREKFWIGFYHSAEEGLNGTKGNG